MVRVLVAEDSPTTRELLVSMLGTDPSIVVVGQARDGVEAVEQTLRLRPDLVTMDIPRPRLDGFEATKQIMVEAPTPIIIISAVVNPDDVVASMEALRAGAVTVLAKPPNPFSPEFDDACRSLTSTVKALSQVTLVRRRPGPTLHPALHPTPAPPAVATTQQRTPRVLAIGASTGGPNALGQVLGALPADFPAPVLVVQHMTIGFLEGFAQWLDRGCALDVRLARHGERLAPRTVYVAPEDHHLGVSASGHVVLSDDDRINGFRPSVSYTFDSAARAFGAATVAVILTGMGSDGVSGLRTVRERGGRVIAQDEETSVVFGMPGSAVAAGVVDDVLPLPGVGAVVRGLFGKAN